jgi:hypothetical protein
MKILESENPTVVGIVAVLALAFLFVMTATEGDYWGANEVEDYIVMITEGDDNSYLDMNSPTAMVSITQEAFIVREGETATMLVCEPSEEKYVIADGQKILKASSMTCKEIQVIEKTEDDPNRHETGYSTVYG